MCGGLVGSGGMEIGLDVVPEGTQESDASRRWTFERILREVVRGEVELVVEHVGVCPWHRADSSFGTVMFHRQVSQTYEGGAAA